VALVNSTDGHSVASINKRFCDIETLLVKKPRNEIASLIATACEQYVSWRDVLLDEKFAQTSNM